VRPYQPGRVAPRSDAEAENPANKFFTNTPAGAVYEGAPAGSASLDYSLQLAVGLREFPGGKPVVGAAAAAEPTNFRGGDEEPPPSDPAPLDEGDDTQETPAAPGGAAAPAAGWRPWMWIVLIGAVAVIAGLVWLLSRQRPPQPPNP
jgi:hypothetical protein